MPIKPENRARYPKDWPQIRAAILERAGNCCEWPGCGVRNGAVGIWKAGFFFKLADSAEEIGLLADAYADEGEKVIRIVLTVAHKDHTPENCDPDNLAAWCQRHHLAYDHTHHITNSYMTRRARPHAGATAMSAAPILLELAPAIRRIEIKIYTLVGWTTMLRFSGDGSTAYREEVLKVAQELALLADPAPKMALLDEAGDPVMFWTLPTGWAPFSMRRSQGAAS